MPKWMIGLILFGIILILSFNCATDESPLASSSHPEDWNKVTAANFHGNKVMTAGVTSCQSCHGSNYDGGTSKVSCYSCHPYPHRDTWSKPGDQQNHGQFIQQANWSLADCQTCHAPDFSGGKSGSACADCHRGYPHPAGWTQTSNAQNHAHTIKAVNWSMVDCQGCHGNDYQGGKSKSSCYNCHQQGPEACNVCHGSANNPAPPKDLNGNTATTEITVGAHQKHLGMGMTCTTCHNLPAAFNSPEHIDQTAHAEVLKDWSWDRPKATCTTFCHYDPNKTYIWNKF